MGLLDREAAAKHTGGKFQPGKYVFKFVSAIMHDGLKETEKGSGDYVQRKPSYHPVMEEGKDGKMYPKYVNGKRVDSENVRQWVIIRGQIIQDGVPPLSAGAFIGLTDDGGFASSKGNKQLETLFEAVGLTQAQADKVEDEASFFKALNGKSFITRIMTDNELLKDAQGNAILDADKKKQYVPKTNEYNGQEQIQYKLSGWFEEVSDANIAAAEKENERTQAKVEPIAESSTEDNKLVMPSDIDTPEPVAPPAQQASENPFDDDLFN